MNPVRNSPVRNRRRSLYLISNGTLVTVLKRGAVI